VKAQVGKNFGIDVNASYHGVVFFGAINSSQTPSASYIEDPFPSRQSPAPEEIHQQPARSPKFISVNGRSMKAFKPTYFWMT
jgi:hypothetical protein